MEAMASRQRDWRTRAKSRIDSRSCRSYSAASWRRRLRPSPDHEAPSITSRSAPRSSALAASPSSGGSLGHQTVTGRSWISSGATSAERWRPVSPPAVRKISSAQVSGASARGSTQWAWIRASSQDGPSGSADVTSRVRDGWRPVSRLIVSAARSAISGWRAITTRFITLVRAAMYRPPGESSPSSIRSGSAQIRASSFSMPSIVDACDCQRSTGSPGRGRLASATRPSVVRAVALRSGATVGPHGRAGPRPPRAPRSRPRSLGSRARARPPRS